MTDIIRADHEALAKIAANFGKESSAAAQMLQQVTQAMQKLQNGGWLGRGSDAFFAEMEQKVVPAVRRLIEALAEAERTTKTISTTMKSADEEASSGLREDVTNNRGGTGAGGTAGGAGSGLGIGAVGGGVAGGASGSSSGASGADSGAGATVGHGGPSTGAGTGVGNSGATFTTDMGMGTGFTTDMGMGSGDYGAGAGLYDGGVGMAADDINRLLDSGSALWGNDGLFGGDGAYGDTLDSNFFPGDYTGSDYLSDPNGGYLGNDPYGFDATIDYGIPGDWLSGVNDSLSDYLQHNYNDYGIPQDWLADVHDGVLTDLQGDALGDSALHSSESGSGGGSSGGGSGSGSTGGGDTPLAETAPLGESSMGSGSGGGTGGGSGGGMPSTMPESGLGRGSMGGGAGGGMPSGIGRVPSDLLGRGSSASLPQSVQAAPGPIRFAYQALGSSGSAPSDRTFTTFSSGGGGTLPAAAPAQASMGLPISLAAVSPFLALLGKSLKRKATDR